MIRCFVALDLDGDVRRRLGELQERLRAALPTEPIRWVRPEGIHLTLKFLGDQPSDRLDSIQEVLSAWSEGTAPIDLRIASAGAFPDPFRPRILWVGVEESSGRLPVWVDRLEGLLESLGVQREGRPFHPHLTLGRVKDRLSSMGLAKLQQELAALKGQSLSTIHVGQAFLFRSDLRPTGAEYAVLAAYPLGRTPGAS